MRGQEAGGEVQQNIVCTSLGMRVGVGERTRHRCMAQELGGHGPASKHGKLDEWSQMHMCCNRLVTQPSVSNMHVQPERICERRNHQPPAPPPFLRREDPAQGVAPARRQIHMPLHSYHSTHMPMPSFPSLPPPPSLPSVIATALAPCSGRRTRSTAQRCPASAPLASAPAGSAAGRGRWRQNRAHLRPSCRRSTPRACESPQDGPNRVPPLARCVGRADGSEPPAAPPPWGWQGHCLHLCMVQPLAQRLQLRQLLQDVRGHGGSVPILRLLGRACVRTGSPLLRHPASMAAARAVRPAASPHAPRRTTAPIQRRCSRSSASPAAAALTLSTS